VRSTEVIRTSSHVIVLAALHIILGLAMKASTAVATVHALGTLLVALRIASRGRVDRLLAIAAYIAGSEVLWRMTEAHIVWEFGKYATILIFFVFLMVKPQPLRWLPILFFLLLLPSSALTASALGFGEARRQISFNLSGPFSLMIAVLVMSRTRLTRLQYQRLFISYIQPTLAIAAIAIAGIVTADEIEFGTESNFATSGGYGPVQVATALSLSTIFALFALLEERRRSVQLFLAAVIIALLGQSMMTFARTGLYLVVGCGSVAALHLVRIKRLRTKLLLAPTAIALVILLVIFPQLNRFTHGNLSARFADTNSSGRDGLAWADLQIWQQHPLLGVGPGMAKWERAKFFRKNSAHTEFTRLLGEHGMLGAGALGLFTFMAVIAYARNREPWSRALVATILFWVVLYMATTAMRLVAPSFLFGLAFVRRDINGALR
jgi:hypothetical protein